MPPVEGGDAERGRLASGNPPAAGISRGAAVAPEAAGVLGGNAVPGWGSEAVEYDGPYGEAAGGEAADGEPAPGYAEFGPAGGGLAPSGLGGSAFEGSPFDVTPLGGPYGLLGGAAVGGIELRGGATVG